MIRQVYVAGSYSADTRTRELHNISKALVAACALVKQGVHPIVPHTSGSHRCTWDEAMDRCRSIIRGMDPVRDYLVLLPGWEGSRGAREERELALNCDLSVLTLDEALAAERTVHHV
jgi:hypothetical protein